ncbi:lipid II flippase MurJ [Clostridium disporicum]|uniref:Integral membrane protein MviN n=1 Tax=Clostridium disporicum TaxID=84024 RepID=A0A174FCL3_9CLOT|nr:lipid II flippase MurJ [Clostridium disporicum]CUO46100.1 integral membrane protein MviN [Clostridium disporicum]
MIKENRQLEKDIVVENSNKKAAKQLIIMIVLTILTQVVTILKTSTVASQFGATIQMDAFNFSTSIGTFIFSFIGAGVTTVLIPNLVKKDKKDSINIFISTLYTIAFLVLLIVYFFRRSIIGVLSSQNDEFILIASNIMLVTLLTQFITSFSGATNAIFQCKGKFNFPKLITLFTTIILIGLIVFMPNLTIYKYAAYIFVTSVLNIIIQIYLVKKNGYKFNYRIDFSDKEFKNMFRTFLPTVLSTGLYQFSLVTDTVISSNLGEGSTSILGYSNSLMTMVNSVILTNLMTYFYPKIAKSIGREDSQERVFDLMILLNGIMCLFLVGFIVVGKSGIILLYERGKFTPTITEMVYIGTLIYMIGIPVNAMRDLVYRYFYANGDTLTPFKNSIVISISNIIISIILSKIFGIYGIIIGTVITSFISFIMILFRFNKKFGFKCNKRKLIIENIKIVLVSITVIVTIKFLITMLPSMTLIIEILLVGIITTLLYTTMLVVFRSKIYKIKL